MFIVPDSSGKDNKTCKQKNKTKTNPLVGTLQGLIPILKYRAHTVLEALQCRKSLIVKSTLKVTGNW